MKVINFPYKNPAEELFAYLMSYKCKVPEISDIKVKTEWDGPNQVIVVIYCYPDGSSADERIPYTPLRNQQMVEDIAEAIVRDLLQERRTGYA
jgi:hypothetical protein